MLIVLTYIVSHHSFFAHSFFVMHVWRSLNANATCCGFTSCSCHVDSLHIIHLLYDLLIIAAEPVLFDLTIIVHLLDHVLDLTIIDISCCFLLFNS